MHKGRRILIGISALGLCVSAAMLVGLKLGRPLYYSDGATVQAGYARPAASMLAWQSAEPRYRLPGPVRGRVQPLPDGRLVYGRALGEARTDLVVYDPSRPEAEPQPLVGVNSRGHDLAPSLDPEGGLLFASDRRGGPGGFDLYRASERGGLFFAPRPLPEGINTGLDETDPCLDAQGGQLVFVRRDPEASARRSTTLMLAAVDRPEEVRPVFPEEEAEHIDRDPCFAPDGLGLYFARQSQHGGLEVLRTFWHQDGFVPAMPLAMTGPARGLRAPAFLDDGSLCLLGNGDPADLHVAAPQELYPYWAGQFWLEWLLFSCLLFFAGLLLLLFLGARWKQLDTLTKLLLLSMAIHLLLLWWIAQMEIIRHMGPDERGRPGAVQVQLLRRNAQGGSAEGQGVQQQSHSVAAELRYAGAPRQLQAALPGSADRKSVV